MGFFAEFTLSEANVPQNDNAALRMTPKKKLRMTGKRIRMTVGMI